MHALFDRNAAQNRWSMHSGQLREFVEHFAPRTEQLDVYAENGRVTFTSYTEKVSNGKGQYRFGIEFKLWLTGSRNPKAPPSNSRDREHGRLSRVQSGRKDTYCN